VPAQWPVRSELFQVALAISFYTVAVTLSPITAFVAAAGGQCGRHDGWLAPIYEVDRGSSYTVSATGSIPEPKEPQLGRDRARTGCSAPLSRPRLCVNRQRIVGIDLKLFEPKTMCPIIAVREREER
jgi:hypothetical protein